MSIAVAPNNMAHQSGHQVRWPTWRARVRAHNRPGSDAPRYSRPLSDWLLSTKKLGCKLVRTFSSRSTLNRWGFSFRISLTVVRQSGRDDERPRSCHGSLRICLATQSIFDTRDESDRDNFAGTRAISKSMLQADSANQANLPLGCRILSKHSQSRSK